MKKDKFRYINNFPFIIMVAVAIVLIILVNIYLNSKPDSVISFNGYMILQNDASYNLMNKHSISEDMNASVIKVSNGDYVYKKLDSYYVGVKEKKEIDYTFPAYSSDGITLYTINEDVNLIRDDFERIEGYSDLSIHASKLYNIADEEVIDDHNYIFLDLKNSIYVSTVSMKINTLNNEYEITVNSPMYFNTKYINYYSFDGVNFKYNRIDDIYYDSIVSIGNYVMTYEEFLLKMGIIKSVVDDEFVEEEPKEEIKDEIVEEEIEVPYQKPTVNLSEFVVGTYYIGSNISITDPSRVVTSNPVFEMYDENGKLVLRKKIINQGDFDIKGLLANTKYHIIGKFEYKNEFGINVEKVFYENDIQTKTIDSLEEINLSSNVGEIYSNKIEIKDLTILNADNEALYGVTRISIKIDDVDYNISYNNISDLKSGKAVTISTPKKLKSNTVYTYEIKFYDKLNNELKTTGMNKGTVKTSKEQPTVSLDYNIKNQNIYIDLITKNKDNVHISNYKYELYSYSGYFVGNGSLIYDDLEKNEITFENLDYYTNYIFKVTGDYDLEDGKGIQKLKYEFEFSIDDMENIIAFYDNSKTFVTTNSITTDFYIKSFSAFERESTEIWLYLANKDGSDILDEDGNLKYVNVYKPSEFEDNFNSYKKITTTFDQLKSNTEYNLKVKVSVKQLEELMEKEKSLEPNILTNADDAYVEVVNSKLLGNKWDLNFKVVDIDNKITNDNFIIEIYEGNYSNLSEIVNQKYIHRQMIELTSDSINYINITLDNYTSNSYTAFISSNPYDERTVKTYLEVLNGNERNLENKNYALNVNREVMSSLEIYNQLPKTQTNKMETKINLSYFVTNATIDFSLLDCVENECTKIGDIYSNGTSSTIDGVWIENIENNMLSEHGNKIDKRITILNDKNKNHKLYFSVKKSLDASLDESCLDNYYILSEIEYNTTNSIYNISTAEDFYKISNSKNHYVVTSNLGFPENTRSLTFSGVIDFQGYSVNVYETITSSSILFERINSGAKLKNYVVNYEISFDGVKTNGYGFVNNNYGVLENFIINVNQVYEDARSQYVGLAARYNYGDIHNFVIYLDSNVDFYYHSGLVTYQNLKPGIVSNGYIATLELNNKIITHDEGSRFGAFANRNTGIIKNVYNLLNISAIDKGVAAAIVYDNDTSSAVVKNTISVAEITKINENGPNVYSNSANSSAFNNYYYNGNNLSHSNKFNQKINKTALRNTGVLETILNNEIEKAFSIVAGYYPTIKMSSFMSSKQTLIPIVFDYTETIVDIVSADVISQDNMTASAIVKLYISNPSKLKINSVDVSNISKEEVLEDAYDENSQMTHLTIKITAEANDPVNTVYEINSFRYDSETGVEIEKEYVTARPRIPVVLYRPVDTYAGLLQALSKNENIYMIANIKYDGISGLPGTNIYSSVLDGNNYTLDLENLNLSRGYFLYNIKNSSIKNLQVSNMNISVDEANQKNYSNTNIGFVRYSEGSAFENIDISNTIINIENSNKIAYVGGLVGSSSSTTYNKVSVNTIKIKTNQLGTDTFRIGGIIGHQDYSYIDHSYVYDIEVSATYDNFSTIKAVGGLVGVSYYATIRNSYAQGSINSNGPNVGGIAGFSSGGSSYSTTITNTYSLVEITSTGNYLGGIIGNTGSVSTIKNNMYLGGINNINFNDDVSTIVPNPTSAIKTANYDLIGEVFKPTTTFMEFDTSKSFSKIDATYPYLIESSFVEQKVKNFVSQQDGVDNYLIEYLNSEQVIVQNRVNAEYAYLYMNEPVYISQSGKNTDESLNIQLITDDFKGFKYKYKVTPNNIFKSLYDIELSDGTNKIMPFEFYRKISDWSDWKKISTTEFENIVILNDLESTPDDLSNMTSKRINNFVCQKSEGKCKISGGFENDITLNQSLIYSLAGTMKNVEFSNFNITNTSTSYLGIISYNSGTINNSEFKNIRINGTTYCGLIAFNSGGVENTYLENITVSGGSYTGGLIGYDYNVGSKVNWINTKTLNITGASYVGGIIGYINSTRAGNNNVSQIVVDDLTLSGTSYLGGITGYGYLGITFTNNKVMNAKISGTGSRIGGLAGSMYSASNLEGINIEITNPSKTATATQVGGIIGYCNGYLYNASAERIYIGNKVDNVITRTSANNVGGLVGAAYRIDSSYVRDSEINAKENVGGLLGSINSYAGSIVTNTVSRTNVYADKYAGGLIGYYYASSVGDSLRVRNNEVISNTGENIVQATDTAGGIIGYVKNNITFMQNFVFEYNYVQNYMISAANNNLETAGGIIGRLYQVPTSLDIKYKNSLFYGTVPTLQYGLGKLENIVSSVSYGEIERAYDFSVLSNFKHFVTNVEYMDSQISNQNEILTNSTFSNINGYFPIIATYKYKDVDRVAIPMSTEGASVYRLMSFSKRPSRTQPEPINIDYDVYASDVDKINIEFSDIDENVSFYYEIGDFTSSIMPIDRHTYTLTYDFKTPIKIYLVNLSTSENKTYQPSSLSRNISIVNNLTYYIKNSILYSETSALKGTFVNLYRNKALSSDGTIYDISSKETNVGIIDYIVLENPTPIYTFNYNGTNIETYYNYSVINGVRKLYQMFIKKNNLSVIDNTLENNKVSSVIDFYNNKEIQIILKDNKLYNLKGDIKYPTDIINENIKDIYSDIYLDSSLIVIEYKSGEIYTFDYITGKKIFSNRYDMDMSFMEYITNKLQENSGTNKIERIASSNGYEEVKKMEQQLIINPIEEAKNMIYQTNENISKKQDYIIVYNSTKEKYDIYTKDELLSNNEDIITENDKIYKDYELVKFYNNSNKKQKNNSLNGILVFTLTILSILAALYLLINRKRMRKAI